MTPTQEDREAAAEIYRRLDGDKGLRERNAKLGSMDDLPLVQAFMRHRLAAEERGARMALEAAAKVARDYATKAKQRGWPMFPDSIEKAARHIATTIRQTDPASFLKDQTNDR